MARSSVVSASKRTIGLPIQCYANQWHIRITTQEGSVNKEFLLRVARLFLRIQLFNMKFRRTAFIGLFTSAFAILFYMRQTQPTIKPTYGVTCKPFKSENSLECMKLFQGNSKILKTSKKWKHQKLLSDEALVNLTSDCNLLKEIFCFPTLPLTAEEAAYPLAFTIIVYNDLEQFIRMFQSFYWPQNLYCIAYDTKSVKALHVLVENIAKCFSNVVMPKEQIKIVYRKHGALNAAMNCMEVLNSLNHQWKYVQILSGHDMPLKTNSEMVKILKVLNGSLDSALYEAEPVRWDMKNERAPNNLTIYKSGFAVTLSREFIDFIVNDQISIDFYKWLNGTLFPEEQYWSTIISNSAIQSPGYYPGHCLKESKKCSISRYQIWSFDESHECEGKFKHYSCVYGVGDLPILIKQPHLVAHKTYWDFEPATFYCMIEWIQNRTYLTSDANRINLEFYKSLPAVLHRKSQLIGTNFSCSSGVKCLSDLG